MCNQLPLNFKTPTLPIKRGVAKEDNNSQTQSADTDSQSGNGRHPVTEISNNADPVKSKSGTTAILFKISL